MAKPLRNNEKGFASMVIALILIIVLALLTLGFSSLARREQQTALDKQLSNQAYYAAETGINDALKDIQDGDIKSTTPNVNTNNCIHPATGNTANNIIDSTTDVSYSCLLVTLWPNSLYYTDVGQGASHDSPFTTVNSSNQPVSISSLTVSWGSADNKTAFRSACSSSCFPQATSWNSPAVLQFALTPTTVPPSTVPDRTSLIKNTFTSYLYPSTGSSIVYGPIRRVPPSPTGTTGGTSGGSCFSFWCGSGGGRGGGGGTGGGSGSGTGSGSGSGSGSGTGTPGSVPYTSSASSSYAQQGPIVSGNCSGSGALPCAVTFTGLSGQGSNFVMQFLDYYDLSNVQITATQTNGSPAYFSNAQVLIDATGRAKNVLKRLQVRIPIKDNSLPGYALESQNTCKREQTTPSYTFGTTFSPVGAVPDPCTPN